MAFQLYRANQLILLGETREYTSIWIKAVICRKLLTNFMSIKWQTKQYHTVGYIPKSNWKS